MPWQKGYSQNGASSMLLHLITVSFPSRGSSEQWDNFYFFVFHFEQAGVSFMRSICSFTSFIQSIYGIAYGNMACSQSRHKTTLIIPRRENISVCVCVCVCVCVFVEETEQYNSRVLFGLVQRLLILPANHSEEELSARSEVQADPTPSSCTWLCFPEGCVLAVVTPKSSCFCLANRPESHQVVFSS